MLPLVGTDILRHDALQLERLILLACMQEDDRGTLEEVLESVWQDLSKDLLIWIVEESALPEVMNRHLVAGTPTFLLFLDGTEVARLLGKVDAPTLKAFVARHGLMLHTDQES